MVIFVDNRGSIRLYKAIVSYFMQGLYKKSFAANCKEGFDYAND